MTTLLVGDLVIHEKYLIYVHSPLENRLQFAIQCDDEQSEQIVERVDRLKNVDSLKFQYEDIAGVEMSGTCRINSILKEENKFLVELEILQRNR